MTATDTRREKAGALVEAGRVFPVPGLRDTAVVLSSDRSMPYVVTFGTGQEACTCLDFEMRQGKVGGTCKHIIVVARLKGRRSLALLNAEEEYDRLTQELNRSGAA